MNIVVNYTSIVADLKEKILYSQSRAITTVNKELVLLYWEIGNTIVQNQSQQGWGAKIIDSLSSDLKKAFPNMKGFSVRNLKYMRQFAFSYPQKQIVQELLAQLNWYHNITIMQKIKDDNIRKWYASKTIENGWSQSVLLHQIESGLYERSKSKKITNFDKTLITPHSELVQEAEYSLRDINKPIGISEYQITKSIPSDLKSELPTIQEIEEQLENEI